MREREIQVDSAALCAEIKAVATQGVTQRAIAHAAGIAPSNLSTVLRGRGYLGQARALRILDAIHRLSAELAAKRAAEESAESKTSGEEQPPAKKATPMVRHL